MNCSVNLDNRLNLYQQSDKINNLAVIHIGKCGGTTINDFGSSVGVIAVL